MSACPICQHAKIQAIDRAIASGRSPNLVRAQYRLDQQMLEAHLAHKLSDYAGSPHSDKLKHLLDKPLRASLSPGGIATAMDFGTSHMTENPLAQFKQAWRDAKDDDRMRAQMVAWLNEQIQQDDMGLP